MARRAEVLRVKGETASLVDQSSFIFKRELVRPWRRMGRPSVAWWSLR